MGVVINSIASYRAEFRETGFSLEKELAVVESAFVEQPDSECCDLLMEV